MDPANVKFLAQTYTNIRASVCIAGKFDAPFTMNEGVRQGCPASPLVFSLYMDRIEEFLREGCVAGFYRGRKVCDTHRGPADTRAAIRRRHRIPLAPSPCAPVYTG